MPSGSRDNSEMEHLKFYLESGKKEVGLKLQLEK